MTREQMTERLAAGMWEQFKKATGTDGPPWGALPAEAQAVYRTRANAAMEAFVIAGLLELVEEGKPNVWATLDRVRRTVISWFRRYTGRNGDPQ